MQEHQSLFERVQEKISPTDPLWNVKEKMSVGGLIIRSQKQNISKKVYKSFAPETCFFTILGAYERKVILTNERVNELIIMVPRFLRNKLFVTTHAWRKESCLSISREVKCRENPVNSKYSLEELSQ